MIGEYPCPCNTCLVNFGGPGTADFCERCDYFKKYIKAENQEEKNERRRIGVSGFRQLCQ